MTLNALLRQSAWPPSTIVACPGRLNDFLENGQVLGLNWCQTLKSRAFMSFQTLHLPAHNPTFHSMALTGSFGWSSEAGFRRGSLLMPSCWFGTLSNVKQAKPAKQFLLVLQLSVWKLEQAVSLQRHQCRLQADRMLDMGFEPQIRKILAKVWVSVANISRSRTMIGIQGYHLIIFEPLYAFVSFYAKFEHATL